MRKTTFIPIMAMAVALYSCGGGQQTGTEQTATETPSSAEAPASSDPASYDPKRGEGKFNAENVKVDAALNATLATAGEKVANVKCFSCHKMTDEKLVGPGWAGVTTRHQPEWIMNFITNPDPMIDKDPKVQAQLEICLVRMPNQSLSDDDARSILEFMRKNDGAK